MHVTITVGSLLAQETEYFSEQCIVYHSTLLESLLEIPKFPFYAVDATGHNNKGQESSGLQMFRFAGLIIQEGICRIFLNSVRGDFVTERLIANPRNSLHLFGLVNFIIQKSQADTKVCSSHLFFIYRIKFAYGHFIKTTFLYIFESQFNICMKLYRIFGSA